MHVCEHTICKYDIKRCLWNLNACFENIGVMTNLSLLSPRQNTTKCSKVNAISVKELGHTWRSFCKEIEREHMLNFHTQYFHWELYAVHTIFSFISSNVYFKNRSIREGRDARSVGPTTSRFFLGSLFGFLNFEEFSSNVQARKFYWVGLLVTIELEFD
jgi:hypothetical protein